MKRRKFSSGRHLDKRWGGLSVRLKADGSFKYWWKIGSDSAVSLYRDPRHSVTLWKASKEGHGTVLRGKGTMSLFSEIAGAPRENIRFDKGFRPGECKCESPRLIPVWFEGLEIKSTGCLRCRKFW